MPRRKLQPPALPLRTQRLLLRAFREDDFEAVHAYGVDPRVYRFMTWGPNTPDQTQAVLDRWLECQSTWPRPRIDLAIELLAERRLVGCISLDLSPKTSTGEFGWALHSSVWGRGYATEAARALMWHGFEAIGLRRIFATCDARNHASRRVMERLGMRREGLLRKDVRARRGWRDSYCYALLRDEWTG